MCLLCKDILYWIILWLELPAVQHNESYFKDVLTTNAMECPRRIKLFNGPSVQRTNDMAEIKKFTTSSLERWRFISDLTVSYQNCLSLQWQLMVPWDKIPFFIRCDNISDSHAYIFWKCKSIMNEILECFSLEGTAVMAFRELGRICHWRWGAGEKLAQDT